MLYISAFNPVRYVNWFSTFVSTEINLYLNIFKEEKRMQKDQKILERALFNDITFEDVLFRVDAAIVSKEQYYFLKAIQFLEVPILLSGVITVVPWLSVWDRFQDPMQIPKEWVLMSLI